jgi:DNA modification methylase
MSKIPLQSMMQLPLFEALEHAGGRARPRDLYPVIAEAVGVDETSREQTKACGDGQSYRVFDQQVRWARQTAVMQGLIAGDRGVWELTDRAYAKLGRIRRGAVVLIYTTPDGFALWAHAEDAARHIDGGSVKLVFTSPPYPVVRRDYGRFTVEQWLDWMKRMMAIWGDLITDDGTIAVNVMDVFESGSPMLSPYVERFTLSAIDDAGLNFAGRMMWHSPTKLGNIQWTSKAKVHPKNSLEHLLLFSKSDRPSWDITRMERNPYAARTVRQSESEAKRGKVRRPSGITTSGAAFALGAGPLPGNLIVAGGVVGSDSYSKRCRDTGVTPHPARFPEKLPRQVILMATDRGDVVYDPMAGSNTTGKVAADLGRRFISSEPMLDYVRSSALRFPEAISHV